MDDEHTLQHYLWANRINHTAFAKKLGVTKGTLSCIHRRKHSPSLITALRIYLESEGYVSLLELLPEAEKEKIQDQYRKFLATRLQVIEDKEVKENKPIK